jgi:hypothetical protein
MAEGVPDEQPATDDGHAVFERGVDVPQGIRHRDAV